MLNEVHSTRSSTRRNALDRLAALSAQAPREDGRDDLGRLCRLQQPRTAHAENGTINGETKALHVFAVPMTVRELEVLVALCKAAPLVHTVSDAAKLLTQLGPYASEAHRQSLKASVLNQHFPPWETLSYELTRAVLALGLHHPSLRSQAIARIDQTIESLTDSAEKAAWMLSQTDNATEIDIAEKALPAIQLTASLLGFLEATAKYVQIWSPGERVIVLQKLRYLLSEKFMVSLEGALSAVRNVRHPTKVLKDWKRWVRHYATKTRPLGAMLLQHAFMRVVEASVVSLVAVSEAPTGRSYLDTLLLRTPLVDRTLIYATADVLENITELIAEEISLLEADADYLQVSSAWQQRLALEVKASSIRSFLCCSLIDEEISDVDVLMSWLDAITADPIQMADDGLGQTVLKCMAILARTSPSIAASLSRSLPRIIVQGKMTPQTGTLAGQCLAKVLTGLSQDVIISSLYSLGNVLSASGNEKRNGLSPFFDGTGSINQSSAPYISHHPTGSTISLDVTDEEETISVYGSVIEATVAIATACHDEKMTALVISMLVQKIGRISPAVDARIITEMAAVGLCGGPNELRALLRLYARIAGEATFQKSSVMLGAVTDARIRLASWIRKDSPLYEVYLAHLLSLCVSSGDSIAEQRTVNIDHASATIRQLLRPMAILVSTDTENKPEFENEEELLSMSRDAWFNMVVHGFTLTSPAGTEYARELQVLAQHTLPLVDENRAEMPESGIDLDTVLRRGADTQHTHDQRSSLTRMLPNCEADIKGLNYPECIFLSAALLVSTLRARGGDCTAVLPYFLESKVKNTALGNCMLAVALSGVNTYLQHALAGTRQDFAAPQIAAQLVTFFEGCCHRISKVQNAAVMSADRIMDQIPSALCQKASLFALLELLSLMWRSCLDAETDEYDWKATYTSEKGHVTVQLSDDVHYRQTTLSNFQKRCRMWVSKAIDAAPLDVKGLLQAYLEDYEDDGAYGHIALGRSFAVEMGSMIPNTDQRLMSLDRQSSVGVNSASDFVAQYTTRQEYRRHFDGKHHEEEQWALVDYNGMVRPAPSESTLQGSDEEEALKALTQRLRGNETIAFAEVRDTLRNAAGILSKSRSENAALIRDLVGIPFIIFTKQSINLGISLWLGVVKENPSLETRVLAEVAAGWESSIRLEKGFFHSSFQHLDPFYVKEEFAPSKWEAISKRQQLVHNLIAPHLRLTHFLSSHFSSSRLTSPFVERAYTRLMRITMLAMKRTVKHPLAREVHFQIVLLALRFLKFSTQQQPTAEWRLQDATLSAGLAWFTTAPRWSFGSNRLQVKAEVKILSDVVGLLQSTGGNGSRAPLSHKSLQTKQELLLQFLHHEIGRLIVWITPLATDSRSFSPLGHSGSTVKDTVFSGLLSTAWAEDPRLAVQLGTRFPRSQQLAAEIRSYIMRQPEKAINEPDALYTMIGSSLPTDVKTQLKYLLYWAPINPSTLR